LYIKYKPFRETEFTATEEVKGTLSPEFKHSKVFHFDKIGQEHLDWFDAGCIAFQLYGRQEDTDPDSTRTRMTTKVLAYSCRLSWSRDSKIRLCRKSLILLDFACFRKKQTNKQTNKKQANRRKERKQFLANHSFSQSHSKKVYESEEKPKNSYLAFCARHVLP